MPQKRNCLFILSLGLFLWFSSLPGRVFAYDMPYPGLMPGNKLYRAEALFDKIYDIFVFGNFANFTYSLGRSDKKLIEAKVLLEYHQYLLGTKAIRISSSSFVKASASLAAAKKEGKNIDEKMTMLVQASSKHREIIDEIEKELPEGFFWKPERGEPEYIDFKGLFQDAREAIDVKK